MSTCTGAEGGDSGEVSWSGRRGQWGGCPWADIGPWMAPVLGTGLLCIICREREPLWVLLALGHFLNHP